jgi:hypothetical protein
MGVALYVVDTALLEKRSATTAAQRGSHITSLDASPSAAPPANPAGARPLSLSSHGPVADANSLVSCFGARDGSH